MSEPESIQRYLDMVESQHKSRSKFMAVLTEYLRPVDTCYNAALKIPEDFSVPYAVGKQLDRIGEIVGVSRRYPYWNGTASTTKEMDDDQYRTVIRARILSNHWKGSFDSYKNAWATVFGDSGVYASVVDNMDMSCTVQISGDFDEDIAALFRSGYIFPKPMGVRINYAVSPGSDRTATATDRSGATVGYVTGRITVTAD